MHKIIVDTNVFISALVFAGTPQQIVKKWLGGLYVLCISSELEGEIIRILRRKFAYSPQSLLQVHESFVLYAQYYYPRNKKHVLRDPKDNFLLELADISNAHYIISGDKDVLTLRKFKNTRILSPKEFLEIKEDL